MPNCPHQGVSQARAKSKKVENNLGGKNNEKERIFNVFSRPHQARLDGEPILH
jgi:hypothetical protein